jgi:hypothetical protein
LRTLPLPPVSIEKIPLLYLKRRVGTQWVYVYVLIGIYPNAFHRLLYLARYPHASMTGVLNCSNSAEILEALRSRGNRGGARQRGFQDDSYIRRTYYTVHTSQLTVRNFGRYETEFVGEATSTIEV